MLDTRLKRCLAGVVLASAVMAGLLVLALAPLDSGLNGSTAERIVALGLLVAGGMAAYGGLVLATGAARFSDLKSLYRGGGAA